MRESRECPGNSSTLQLSHPTSELTRRVSRQIAQLQNARARLAFMHQEWSSLAPSLALTGWGQCKLVTKKNTGKPVPPRRPMSQALMGKRSDRRCGTGLPVGFWVSSLHIEPRIVPISSLHVTPHALAFLRPSSQCPIRHDAPLELPSQVCSHQAWLLRSGFLVGDSTSW